jgi:hypothetical protein
VLAAPHFSSLCIPSARSFCVFLFSHFMAQRIDMKWNLCISPRSAANTPSRMKYKKKNHFIPAAQNVLTPLAPIAFVRTFFVSVHLGKN